MDESTAFDTPAHRLLADLDARHDLLLVQLEQLDQRIETVLKEATETRKPVALAT